MNENEKECEENDYSNELFQIPLWVFSFTIVSQIIFVQRNAELNFRYKIRIYLLVLYICSALKYIQRFGIKYVFEHGDYDNHKDTIIRWVLTSISMPLCILISLSHLFIQYKLAQLIFILPKKFRQTLNSSQAAMAFFSCAMFASYISLQTIPDNRDTVKYDIVFVVLLLASYISMALLSLWANNKIANSDLTVGAIKLYFDETREQRKESMILSQENQINEAAAIDLRQNLGSINYETALSDDMPMSESPEDLLINEESSNELKIIQERFSTRSLSVLTLALTNEMVKQDQQLAGCICNRELLSHQQQSCYMLFFTYLFSSTCFPSLIIYKPLMFLAIKNIGDNKILQMTSLGAINVGCYLIFEAIGSFITICFQKNIEKQLSNILCYSVAITELLLVVGIYWDTLAPNEKDKIISFCLQNALALTHGALVTFYTVKQPPLKDVPYNR